MYYKHQMAIMKFLILYNIMIEKLRYNNKEMKNEHNRAKIELNCDFYFYHLINKIYPIFIH